MGSILKVKDKNSGKWIDIPAIKGDDGKSAYELAVESGYEGTEEDLIATFNTILNGVEVAHLINKDNPHEVTAEQAEALPIEGGTLSGDLEISTNNGKVKVTAGGSYSSIMSYSTDASNRNTLFVGNDKYSDPLYALRFLTFKDNTNTGDYSVLHKGNYSNFALPKTGGDLEGLLNFTNNDNYYALKKHRIINEVDNMLTIGVGANGASVIENYKDNVCVGRFELSASGMLFKEGSNVAGYKIFGEHNKPSGTYTGTGGVSRTIDVGGAGYTVCIHYACGMCLATPAGILHWTINGETFCDASTYKHIGRNYGYFENGKLFFSADAAGLLDLNGYTYWYQVL